MNQQTMNFRKSTLLSDLKKADTGREEHLRRLEHLKNRHYLEKLLEEHRKAMEGVS